MNLDRTQELRRSGVASQSQLDQAKTQFDVAERTRHVLRLDRAVVAQQVTEGAVLAPIAGRVLQVPVTNGTGVARRTVAQVAEATSCCARRPEAPCAACSAGDKVRLDGTEIGTRRGPFGTITLVYPQIQAGGAGGCHGARRRRVFRRPAHPGLGSGGRRRASSSPARSSPPASASGLRDRRRRRRTSPTSRCSAAAIRRPRTCRTVSRSCPGCADGDVLVRHETRHLRPADAGDLRSPLTPLFLLAALAAGLLALLTIPREEDPQIHRADGGRAGLRQRPARRRRRRTGDQAAGNHPDRHPRRRAHLQPDRRTIR